MLVQAPLYVLVCLFWEKNSYLIFNIHSPDFWYFFPEVVTRSTHSLLSGSKNLLVALHSFSKTIYVRENKVAFLSSEYSFPHNVDCIAIMYSKNKNKLV